MARDDIVDWFEVNRSFFEDMDKAAERLLRPAGTQNRRGFELSATWLLAVLVRGEQLPPIPDDEAQRQGDRQGGDPARQPRGLRR